jgi:hypothetical protein
MQLNVVPSQVHKVYGVTPKTGSHRGKAFRTRCRIWQATDGGCRNAVHRDQQARVGLRFQCGKKMMLDEMVIAGTNAFDRARA